MADRHSIVVRIVAGQVRSVAFCECCPPLTIEVRIYGSVEPQPDEACSPVDLNEDRSRDGLGEYRSQFFEPDDEWIAGDTVSIVVTGHLLERYPGGALAANSKSDYPDIFLKTYDYSMLPVRSRGDKVYGAAVRGKQRKPVRVPDGLEIKTSRNGASIDCHYPHVGLHLMLSFNTLPAGVEVDDVLAAFLRREDYRISERRTEATTVKASFSRSPFVSLLSVEWALTFQPPRSTPRPIIPAPAAGPDDLRGGLSASSERPPHLSASKSRSRFGASW